MESVLREADMERFRDRTKKEQCMQTVEVVIGECPRSREVCVVDI